MVVARVLRRLLQVLAIEEEQAQRALEAVLAELRQLKSRLKDAVERERAGRELVMAGAHSGDVLDRMAGIEEISLGKRMAVLLRRRIATTEEGVVRWREELLSRRVARKQVETLISEAEQKHAIEVQRRSQQSLDDWHLGRMRRATELRDVGSRSTTDEEHTTA